MSERPEWFLPRRYGMGASLPISWQGWLVVLGYIGAVMGSLFLFGETLPAWSMIGLATLLFLLITARTTRGGWRWRWGGEED